MGDNSYYEESHAAQDDLRYDGARMCAGGCSEFCAHVVGPALASALAERAERRRIAMVSRVILPPSVQDWKRIKDQERREQDMAQLPIEVQIKALTAALVEVQMLKAMRGPLVTAFSTLEDGAVVYWERSFPGSPNVSYKFAAVRGGDKWFITGRHDPKGNYLTDQDFIETLDNAQYIELVRPRQEILRSDDPERQPEETKPQSQQKEVTE